MMRRERERVTSLQHNNNTQEMKKSKWKNQHLLRATPYHMWIQTLTTSSYFYHYL
jgi:hypothetical protein